MIKPIILIGQRVRSGTNFVGSTISMHPDVITIPQQISLGELNLFRDNAIIKQVYNKIKNSSFGLEFTAADEAKFLIEYGQLWLRLLIEKYDVPDDKTIFIKSPIIDNFDLWKKTFPKSQIAVIYRDGRDNVISSVKASNDRRSWHSPWMAMKKRINYLSGRSFINHSKQWAKSAKHLLDLNEGTRLQLFKYEEINNSAEGIRALFDHFELKTDDDIIDNCLKAPVVGSSFGHHDEKVTKPNWKPETDKSKFKFSQRWHHWGFFKKTIFKRIAGKELIALRFEDSFKW